MALGNFFKFKLLNKPLELTKTHDFCASGKPQYTVVFLHGIASNSNTFQNTLRYLEGTRSLENMRFVTFDLLGAGESYKSDELKYGYTEQLEALDNAISKLKARTPIILVGHSMGCLIAVRYAERHKKTVSNLILVSPPMFSEKDLDNPAFNVAMDGFKKAVSLKDHSILKDKMFVNSLEKIVKNRNNYRKMCELTTPAVIIYGDADAIIAAHNIPKVVRENHFVSAIKTIGGHSVSREKYNKIREVLEEVKNA